MRRVPFPCKAVSELANLSVLGSRLSHLTRANCQFSSYRNRGTSRSHISGFNDIILPISPLHLKKLLGFLSTNNFQWAARNYRSICSDSTLSENIVFQYTHGSSTRLTWSSTVSRSFSTSVSIYIWFVLDYISRENFVVIIKSRSSSRAIWQVIFCMPERELPSRSLGFLRRFRGVFI